MVIPVQIGEAEIKMLVITDNTSRVVMGLTDSNVIVTEGFNVLLENQTSKLRFIKLEDGSVKAVAVKEGMVFPEGTMTSEQFVENSILVQKQKEAAAKETEDKPSEQKE